MRSTPFTLLCYAATALAANFNLIKEYAGSTFFDDWDYYGHWDNLMNGNVIFVNKTNATNLAYVAPSGHAILTVDNTTVVPQNFPRNSVYISSQDYFEIGTVFVVDVVHMPWGCSVWPAIWTKGTDWPANGEIDILEGVNRMTYNQMALHTNEGCSAAANTDQTGTPGAGPACWPKSGCTVKENTPNSFGDAFNSNGGGVWAMQFDVSGVFIWFWQRNEIPTSISSASSTSGLDISSWGPPSAAYPSGPTCNISQHLGPQQLVIDITLCGDWAGVNTTYAQTCGNITYNACYLTNVIEQGTYDDAWFEISYIRVFGLSDDAVVPESAINGSTSVSGATTPTGGSTATPGSPTSDSPGGGSTGGSTGGSGGTSDKTQTGGAQTDIVLVPTVLTAVAAALAFLGLLL